MCARVRAVASRLRGNDEGGRGPRMKMEISLIRPELDVPVPSGPPFDCVGRRATARAIPLRSGRTMQVSALC